MKTRNVLAFDLGASSGRAIVGSFDGSQITLKETHRFSNDPVTVNGTMYWDTLRLFYEIKQGLLKAKLGGGFDSIGVDTWGVDFGLLGKDGALVGNPVHYRDARSTGMVEASFHLLDRRRFYELTGNQFMDINTAFQLLAVLKKQPELLERTETMLMMPDLFNYFMTGIKKAEYTISSTTQLLDARKRVWSGEVIRALGLPERIFPEFIASGTVLGPLTEEIRQELELPETDVIAVCEHDTQSAMVSVPTDEKDFIFVSCGTWSLFGTELPGPIINEKSEALNMTNEGGFGGRTSFLKNIVGLWLIQESRRQWRREGIEFSFGELEQKASLAKPFKCFVNPDDPVFIPAGNIPRRIREYCKNTGQEIPETEGEIVRCIDESLAFRYRDTLDEIRACTGKNYKRVHIVGGGTQSALLSEMTACACNTWVTAGPVEATVYGNVALQLMAEKELKDLSEVRQLIRASKDISSYEPKNRSQWEDAYERYRRVTGRS